MADPTIDPTRRIRSRRHAGIYYRERKDGSRAYSVAWRGKFVAVEGGENAALAKQAELRGKDARGERVVLPTRALFETVAESWFERAAPGLRPGTARDYRSVLDRVLIPKLGARKLASIGVSDIFELVREGRDKDRSDSTIANRLKPLRAILDYAVLEDLIPSNPFARIPRGKLPSCNATREHREWTTEEVAKLVRLARERDKRKEARGEYGLAIEAKLRLGLRLGELLGLQYQDIEDDVLLVRRQLTKDGRVDVPKTDKSIRRVPLPGDLRKVLLERKLALGASGEDFVFASKKGSRPPSHTNWRRRGWNPAVKDAKLNGGIRVTPHDARHAFASQMASLGLTSSDVAETLGHTTAGVTERIYTHAFDREQREARVRQAMTQAAGSS